MNEPPAPTEGDLTSFRNRNYQYRSESRYKSPLAAIGYVRLPEGPGPRETVWMANVSCHGIGFLCKFQIPVRARLLIELPPLAAQKRELTGHVIHATQQLSGDWLIGCRLDTPLSHEELDLCLTFDTPFFTELKQ
jgi:hypothetical protein